MKSATLPSFWEKYYLLDTTIKQQAKKAYRLWLQNPFHPSLHFKCINAEENIWSVRITRGYRAVGVFEGGTVTWFWIGSHDGYERFFS
ncbi:MAG TPA: hypothetical protein DCS91_14630 [Microcoleaceae bacterium UBA11344]|jgi:hypothetical protein|nr:hypothetical protein [Microcoleaceae cyanobacterium UBA11344]